MSLNDISHSLYYSNSQLLKIEPSTDQIPRSVLASWVLIKNASRGDFCGLGESSILEHISHKHKDY